MHQFWIATVDSKQLLRQTEVDRLFLAYRYKNRSLNLNEQLSPEFNAEKQCKTSKQRDHNICLLVDRYTRTEPKGVLLDLAKSNSVISNSRLF